MNTRPGDHPRLGADQHRERRPARSADVTVAVTGPTGAVGRSVIRALERDSRVGRIIGMARRPFEPAFLGWRKIRYRCGDVRDRSAVDDLVADADVVIHLAYAILGSRGESARVNLTGSRNVFAAATAARRPGRLVFMSSVAAYGYHAGNPVPLTEDVQARGSPEHYYSAHKAASEALLAEVTAGSGMNVYVLRPCIVVGPDAMPLVRSLQLDQIRDRLPAVARQLGALLPALPLVLPDPGVLVQLVHHDDVGTATCAAAMGDGAPGAYNLAAAGEVTIAELARTIGAYSVPVPHVLAVAASKLLSALPWVPAEAGWVHAARQPMLMDATRARRELAWEPRYTAREALISMAGVDFAES